eukprot:353801-Chlamydomonas_euryale.AAC.2
MAQTACNLAARMCRGRAVRLELRACRVTTSGAQALAAAISCGGALRELVLSGNCQVGAGGVAAFAPALASPLCPLRRLCLADCEAGDAAAVVLAAALAGVDRSACATAGEGARGRLSQPRDVSAAARGRASPLRSAAAGADHGPVGAPAPRASAPADVRAGGCGAGATGQPRKLKCERVDELSSPPAAGQPCRDGGAGSGERSGGGSGGGSWAAAGAGSESARGEGDSQLPSPGCSCRLEEFDLSSNHFTPEGGERVLQAAQPGCGLPRDLRCDRPYRSHPSCC